VGRLGVGSDEAVGVGSGGAGVGVGIGEVGEGETCGVEDEVDEAGGVAVVPPSTQALRISNKRRPMI
jgi:hypothetical protein